MIQQTGETSARQVLRHQADLIQDGQPARFNWPLFSEAWGTFGDVHGKRMLALSYLMKTRVAVKSNRNQAEEDANNKSKRVRRELKVWPNLHDTSSHCSLESHGQTVSIINRFQPLSEISAGLQHLPELLAIPEEGVIPEEGLQTVLSATNLKCTPQDVYAGNDIQYIVQCAATEIDTHGHAAIIVATYTEYVASFDAGQWTNFANEPPAGQRRFAFSEGDEINKNCYADDYLAQQQLNSTGMTLNSALDTFAQTTRGALIAYTFHLFANLTEAQYELVVGGEQILWSEQSGPQNVDSIVWPRAASSAEIFWSEKQPIGAALDVTEALPRLHNLIRTWSLFTIGLGIDQSAPLLTRCVQLSFTQNLTYVKKFMPLLCEKPRSEMEVDEMFE
ncbi:hypothetical protein C8R48DRAFT_670279 [Suillus tomentosus]|nr:hypothetical protein C8R48DRAFT_670279 [Suillus tomentosus]